MKKRLPKISDITIPTQFKEIEGMIEGKTNTFSTRILELSNKVQNINDIPVLQSQMLVLRHDLTEEIMVMQSQLHEINYKIDKYKKKVLLYYKTESDFTLNNFSETNTVINADVSFLSTTRSMLIEYVEFLRECRKTLDSMGFAIKNRIDLMKTENI